MRRTCTALIVAVLCAGTACSRGSEPVTSPPPHPVGSAHKLTADHPGDPLHNLLKQRSFDDGVMLPWNTSFGGGARGRATVKDGALCLNIEQPGKERWDAQVRHREMVIQKGRKYTLSFKAWASRDTKVAGKVGMSGPPYHDYWTRPLVIKSEPTEYAFEFSMNRDDDPTAELAFHAGGAMVQGQGPIEVCFDDLVLSDPEFTPPPPPERIALPNVRVNQHGYLPSFVKLATLVTPATEAQPFELLDSTGKVVHSGQTTPHGPDASSGDHVQVVDFSAFTTPGKGYVLSVGDQRSDPFDIDPALYASLQNDAFKYFYHNRSGVEIVMPFASHPQWARPAGHAPDVVTCAPEAVLVAAGWFEGGGCSYQLDVTGGWYDAGDHGKYVVNGGISAWTLLNWYERVKHLGGNASAFADTSGLLPESGNGVPDILDEARWQMEFMLRMQAKQGPYAGMVHHKMHDKEWTALGLAPHQSQVQRFLRPVSTAATLNLAATAAQAARIFAGFDAEFAARCRSAAEAAWVAASKFPALLAPADGDGGGGPYDDDDVSDEFFWAAAELFLTTGGANYEKAMTESRWHGKFRFGVEQDGSHPTTSMTWREVDSLGKISLAIVERPGSKLAAELRTKIVAAADRFLELAQAQGYRAPLGPDSSGKFPWGSNSFALNNMLVLALAQDFTRDGKYGNGVVLGMDYLLGRNAMAKSYVTGYGERPLENPHHRFWAKQANVNFPPPPPGAVSGGPNSSIQDPYAQAAGLAGCAPQKCFMDHIESWSTNEITINWNAPLTWVAAWLNEHGEARLAAPPPAGKARP